MTTAAAPETRDITCPRCGVAATVRFYGPCDQCRTHLRATMHVASKEVDASYDPKMNVTPNAVASKE